MKEWTTPESRNTPSTVNLEEEEIVDAPGNDDNASMPEQIKRPNPWRKMMMMMMMIYCYKIRSQVIRKELEISGIQDVRLKYKQNWIIHLERMDSTRLPKHALNHKPRGRRDRGCPRKRWQCVDAGTGQTT